MIATPQKLGPRIRFDSPQFILSCLGVEFRDKSMSEANAEIRKQVKDMTLEELRGLATRCVEKSYLKDSAGIIKAYEALLTTLENYKASAQNDRRLNQRVA